MERISLDTLLTRMRSGKTISEEVVSKVFITLLNTPIIRLFDMDANEMPEILYDILKTFKLGYLGDPIEAGKKKAYSAMIKRPANLLVPKEGAYPKRALWNDLILYIGLIGAKYSFHDITLADYLDWINGRDEWNSEWTDLIKEYTVIRNLSDDVTMTCLMNRCLDDYLSIVDYFPFKIKVFSFKGDDWKMDSDYERFSRLATIIWLIMVASPLIAENHK